mmetsp:Transcript_2056/g.4109  ORF Transcript_2056/g.4109 Transcript_2056/m.4109 type:complete len:136 (-) Transcript_2056:161-568(-)
MNVQQAKRKKIQTSPQSDHQKVRKKMGNLQFCEKESKRRYSNTSDDDTSDGESIDTFIDNVLSTSPTSDFVSSFYSLALSKGTRMRIISAVHVRRRIIRNGIYDSSIKIIRLSTITILQAKYYNISTGNILSIIQ